MEVHIKPLLTDPPVDRVTTRSDLLESCRFLDKELWTVRNATLPIEGMDMVLTCKLISHDCNWGNFIG